LEPMGVKKSKTLAADKARSLTVSSAGLTSHSRSRYLDPFNPYTLSLPNELLSVSKSSLTPTSSSRPPPILPHPLPPLQSAESPSPLIDHSLARTSSYLQGIEEPLSLSASASQDRSKAAKGDVGGPSGSPNTSFPSNQHLNSRYSSSVSSDIESGGPKTLSGNSRRKPTPVFTPLARRNPADPRCISPEHLELSVMFPQTAHYEIWDLSDQ
jgi:hypothetical protein